MLRVPNSDPATGRKRWMINADGKCVQATPATVLKWRRNLLLGIGIPDSEVGSYQTTEVRVCRDHFDWSAFYTKEQLEAVKRGGTLLSSMVADLSEEQKKVIHSTGMLKLNEGPASKKRNTPSSRVLPAKPSVAQAAANAKDSPVNSSAGRAGVMLDSQAKTADQSEQELETLRRRVRQLQLQLEMEKAKNVKEDQPTPSLPVYSVSFCELDPRFKD